MKIEVDVPEELVQQLSREAIEAYLTRKAESLYQLLQTQSAEEKTSFTDDTEASEKAWQKFNKRGMSC